MSSWHDTGRRAARAADPERPDGRSEERREFKPPDTFWVAKPTENATTGNVGVATLLDNEVTIGRIHDLKKGGKFHRALCSSLWTPCPLDGGHQSKPVGALTIVKHWKGEDGTPKFFKQLLLMTTIAAEDFFRWQVEEWQGLRGCMVKFFRSTAEKSPSIGDGFAFQRKLTESEIQTKIGKRLEQFLTHTTPEAYLRPYDYAKVWKPSAEDVRLFAGQPGRGMMERG